MNWIKKYFYFSPLALFLPAIFNFFSGDDWFHLRITQVTKLTEVLNFFSFTSNPQSASFYRPLSTQVFFYVFQNQFGLMSWPYYLFGLCLFAYSIHLVYKFSGNKLSAFIYAISVSNFTRVYFLSSYQELFLVIFSLLCLINFKEKPSKSYLFFILALLSKETAIVIPILALILNWSYLKRKFKFIVPFFIISAVYLYFRIFYFGLVSGDSYVWNFSFVKATNTLMWYILWCFGAPELLVDYVGSSLRLVPKFFVDYQTWWRTIVFPLLGILASVAILTLGKIKRLDWNLLKHLLFFFISLLPVLFLPSHKFALELGLPLVGFSLAIVWLLPKKTNFLSLTLLTLFVSYNIAMNYLTYTRHYSVSRGIISKKVYSHFKEQYSLKPLLISSGDRYLEFINDSEEYGEAWGQSKQISQTLSGSDFFKVLYHDLELKVYYQDNKEARPSEAQKTPIYISSNQFLK